MIHSYVFYPLLMHLLAMKKKPNEICYSRHDAFPFISVLLAVHNEEQVIAEKIESTLNTSYPLSQLEFIIGSDASDDGTDSVVQHMAAAHPQINPVRFDSRTGKAGIINSLAAHSRGELFVLTDANVFFTCDTLFELAKHFKNNRIAVVAGNIRNDSAKNEGIARQERDYQVFENHLKCNEGVVWGCMMGAFGGCYAVRKDFFSPTPERFIVDDFYITLSALEKQGKAISEPLAICHEDVGTRMREEFRRKSRIGAGNFQLLSRFWKLLLPWHGPVAFTFLSHKVFRWLGPFFILAAYFSSFVLMSYGHRYYKLLFELQTLLLLLPFLDFLLSKLKIQLRGLRYLSHFYVMNLALLTGFIKFLTGIKDNVWQPTKRNQ